MKTLKKTTAFYKDPSSGEFKSFNIMGEKTAEEIITAVEATGREVLNSIPEDYTTLSNEVTQMASDIEELNQGGLILKEDFIDQQINEWLDEHPEATTTIQDGSITESKLASELKIKIDKSTVDLYQIGGVPNNENFDNAKIINDYFSTHDGCLIIPEGNWYIKSYISISNYTIICNGYLVVANDFTPYQREHGDNYFDCVVDITNDDFQFGKTNIINVDCRYKPLTALAISYQRGGYIKCTNRNSKQCGVYVSYYNHENTFDFNCYGDTGNEGLYGVYNCASDNIFDSVNVSCFKIGVKIYSGVNNYFKYIHAWSGSNKDNAVIDFVSTASTTFDYIYNDAQKYTFILKTDARNSNIDVKTLNVYIHEDPVYLVKTPASPQAYNCRIGTLLYNWTDISVESLARAYLLPSWWYEETTGITFPMCNFIIDDIHNLPHIDVATIRANDIITNVTDANELSKFYAHNQPRIKSPITIRGSKTNIEALNYPVSSFIETENYVICYKLKDTSHSDTKVYYFECEDLKRPYEFKKQYVNYYESSGGVTNRTFVQTLS